MGLTIFLEVRSLILFVLRWRVEAISVDVCPLESVDRILEAPSIGGMHVDVSSWTFLGDDILSGAQVDMLLDRKDGIVHLCETKFTLKEFVITKD